MLIVQGLARLMLVGHHIAVHLLALPLHVDAVPLIVCTLKAGHLLTLLALLVLAAQLAVDIAALPVIESDVVLHLHLAEEMPGLQA